MFSPISDISMPVSRRELLGAVGLSTLAPLFAGAWPRAAAAASPAPAPLNRFPRMVQEYFVEQVRAAERKGLQAQAALHTRTDAERYVQEVRRKIRDSFGP